jgi:hypothetical protein
VLKRNAIARNRSLNKKGDDAADMAGYWPNVDKSGRGNHRGQISSKNSDIPVDRCCYPHEWRTPVSSVTSSVNVEVDAPSSAAAAASLPETQRRRKDRRRSVDIVASGDLRLKYKTDHLLADPRASAIQGQHQVKLR